MPLEPNVPAEKLVPYMLTANGSVTGFVQSSQPAPSIRVEAGIDVPVPNVKL